MVIQNKCAQSIGKLEPTQPQSAEKEQVQTIPPGKEHFKKENYGNHLWSPLISDAEGRRRMLERDVQLIACAS